MALREGCRRLRLAGKVLVVSSAAALTVAAVLTAFTAGLHLTAVESIASLFFALGLFAGFNGGVLWLLGWLLEGAAGPRTASFNRRPTR